MIKIIPNNKIKILHFSQVLGGVEKYIELYLDNSDDTFFENSLILPENTKLDKKELLFDKLYKVNIKQSFSIFYLLKNILLIRKILRKNSPDILYLHSTFAGVIGRFAALGLGIKVIYNPHGWSFKMNVSSFKRRFYKLIEKSLSYITDHLILISKSEYQEAMSLGIGKSKLSQIYNGINIESILEHQDKKDFGQHYVIGMVGRVSEQKNPLFFIDFANEIYQKFPDSFFVIIGDGDLRSEAEKRIAHYGLEKNFLITGWINNPKDYIATFDQAVLFSKWEGFGLAVAEYMLYKKPIIISDIDGMSELVENGKTGFSIEPNNLAEAVEKSISLRNDNMLAKQLGSKAYEKLMSEFSMEKNIKQVELLFKQLLEKN